MRKIMNKLVWSRMAEASISSTSEGRVTCVENLSHNEMHLLTKKSDLSKERTTLSHGWMDLGKIETALLWCS
jgi:hypothetical protein